MGLTLDPFPMKEKGVYCIIHVAGSLCILGACQTRIMYILAWVQTGGWDYSMWNKQSLFIAK